MSKRTRMILIVGAGALALYLLYRWYESNNSNTSAAAQTAAEQAAQAADGSSGAGGATGEDIGSALDSLSGQEQSDVSALSSELATDEGLIGTQGTTLTALQSTVAAQALGEAKYASQLSGLEHKLGVTYGKIKPAKGYREKGVGGGWFEEVKKTVKPKPKATHPKSHQSRAKNSGSVAASTHETKPRTTASHSAKATESGSAKKTSARTHKPAKKKVARRG